MKNYYLSYNVFNSDVIREQIYIFKSCLSLDKVKYLFDIYLGPEEFTQDGDKYSINTLCSLTNEQYKSYGDKNILTINIASWFNRETSGQGLQKIKNYFLLPENKDIYEEFADYFYGFPPTQEEYLIKNIIE